MEDYKDREIDIGNVYENIYVMVESFFKAKSGCDDIYELIEGINKLIIETSKVIEDIQPNLLTFPYSAYETDETYEEIAVENKIETDRIDKIKFETTNFRDQIILIYFQIDNLSLNNEELCLIPSLEKI